MYESLHFQSSRGRFPPLCGEEDELQSESLGSGADAASIPRPFAASSLID
jgi:hypothetical protein